LALRSSSTGFTQSATDSSADDPLSLGRTLIWM
jgi:hypothetical protein